MKYRVWDIDGGMYYPDQTGRYLLSMGGRIVDGDGNPYDETHIPLLYTGIKDKNSVEIYEGDILEGINLFGLDGSYLGDVRYVPCRYQCFVKYPNGGYGGIILDDSEVLEHQLEVVGNIYENPELIKN